VDCAHLPGRNDPEGLKGVRESKKYENKRVLLGGQREKIGEKRGTEKFFLSCRFQIGKVEKATREKGVRWMKSHGKNSSGIENPTRSMGNRPTTNPARTQ